MKYLLIIIHFIQEIAYQTYRTQSFVVRANSFNCFPSTVHVADRGGKSFLTSRAIYRVYQYSVYICQGSEIGLCTLCFCFPTKMLHLNAPFFPLKCSVTPKKSLKCSDNARHTEAFLLIVTF